MERTQLVAKPRTEAGTWAAKRLRKQGLVPGVIYGKGMETQSIQLDARALLDFLRSSHAGALVDVKISDGDGERTETAMLREVQRNPITGQPLNVDFHRISLEEEVTTAVPINLVGESEAAKRGGILEQILWEVRVSCLPTLIPERFEVDISSLEIGDSLHADVLRPPEGVTLQAEPDEVIVVMAAPRIEEEVAAPTEEELEEAEAAEPELVGKPKREGEEAEAPEEEETPPSQKGRT